MRQDRQRRCPLFLLRCGCWPLLALLLTLALLAAASPASAADSRAVLAFLPEGGDDNPAPVLDRLDARPQLALGLVSATQGLYSPGQTLLDISAGSRTSAAVYKPRRPPPLELVLGGDGAASSSAGADRRARRDGARRDRAGPARQPIPGGVGYAGVKGRTNLEAVAAADQQGDIAAVSLGTAATLADACRRAAHAPSPRRRRPADRRQRRRSARRAAARAPDGRRADRRAGAAERARAAAAARGRGARRRRQRHARRRRRRAWRASSPRSTSR